MAQGNPEGYTIDTFRADHQRLMVLQDGGDPVDATHAEGLPLSGGTRVTLAATEQPPTITEEQRRRTRMSDGLHTVTEKTVLGIAIGEDGREDIVVTRETWQQDISPDGVPQPVWRSRGPETAAPYRRRTSLTRINQALGVLTQRETEILDTLSR